eukprot:20335-Heterocapsa_arctica.AAC.1
MIGKRRRGTQRFRPAPRLHCFAPLPALLGLRNVEFLLVRQEAVCEPASEDANAAGGVVLVLELQGLLTTFDLFGHSGAR